MADTTLHHPVTDDSAYEFVKSLHSKDDPPPSDEGLKQEASGIVASARANESWRQSLPFEQQMALQGTPAVSIYSEDNAPVEATTDPNPSNEGAATSAAPAPFTIQR